MSVAPGAVNSVPNSEFQYRQCGMLTAHLPRTPRLSVTSAQWSAIISGTLIYIYIYICVNVKPVQPVFKPVAVSIVCLNFVV